MKNIAKIIFIVLAVLTIVCSFLPAATFKDDSSGKIQADIEKQAGRVTEAEDKLQRWIEAGTKSESEMQKQRDKIQKEKDKLDALKIEQLSLANASDDITYKFVQPIPVAPILKTVDGEDKPMYVKLYYTENNEDSTVYVGFTSDAEKQNAIYELLADKDKPAQDVLDKTKAAAEDAKANAKDAKTYPMQLDKSVFANYQVYMVDFTLYDILRYVSPALLIVAVALIVLGGKKPVFVGYTIAAFLTLIVTLCNAYIILRLSSLPIAQPFASPSLNLWVVLPMIFLPIIMLGINVTCNLNSKRSMIYVFCVFLCVLAIIPFWVMIVNATRSSSQIQAGVSLIPSKFLERNWNVLKTKDFNVWKGMLNSLTISVGGCLFSLFFSVLTAYGFKCYNFVGNKVLYAIVLGIIMIPGQVTATGFFMQMMNWGLTNNYWALVLPGIAAASTVFFFRQYLEANFQISLVEAGRIDGAGEFRIFLTVVLPIMLPAMATMGIMAMIGSWNNYMTPAMLLSIKAKQTLPMMVKELRGDIYRTEYGSIYLGLTMTAIPLLVVYFALSKFIIAGVALGGVKE